MPGQKLNQLSTESFTAFEPFINIFGCGQKVHIPQTGKDEPRPMITKETRELFRRYKAGERSLQYHYGYPFKPWHFIGDIFSAKHVDQQVFGNEIFYYTSNQRQFGLVYIDVDAHYQFQTDAQHAVTLLNPVFAANNIFWRDSSRGMNGYLKIQHNGRIDEYNALLKKLEGWLQAHLRSNNILCDVEVKGGINTKAKNACLAKLPFSTFKGNPWNHQMLQQFQAMPVLPLQYLADVVATLESRVDVVKANQFNAHVNDLKKAPTPIISLPEFHAGDKVAMKSYPEVRGTVMGYFPAERTYTVLLVGELFPQAVQDRIYCPTGVVNQYRIQASAMEIVELTCDTKTFSVDEATVIVPVVEASVDEPLPMPKLNLTNVDEPDSYKRQLNGLLVFSRRIKRVPTVMEALAFVKENSLFTGDWSDNASRRKARVRHILTHIAKTFDSTKCNEGHVDVDKYRDWAKDHFPLKISICASWVDSDLQRHSSSRGVVTHEDVAVYLSIFDFCLENGQSLKDSGIPHARIVSLWQKLYQDGKTKRSVNDAKIRVIREKLAQYQIINITDRCYSPVDHMGGSDRSAFSRVVS